MAVLLGWMLFALVYSNYAAAIGSTVSSSILENCVHGGVNTYRLTEGQHAAREEQDRLACHRNNSDIENFHNRTLEGVRNEKRYMGMVGRFLSNNFACRANDTCPGAEVTWCIYVYSSSNEQIEICFNKDGVINATDYALLLQLQCHFHQKPGTSDIVIQDAMFFLDKSLLVCTVQSDSCSDIASTEISVQKTGLIDDIEFFIGNSTNVHLVLGRTNIILCKVVFATYDFFSYSYWLKNGERVQPIYENPFCESDCERDTMTTTERNDRVRTYRQFEVITPDCSSHYQIDYLWLWIDNATELDAKQNFSCGASSGLWSVLEKESEIVNLMPVLPLVEVQILEVPVVANSSTLGKFDIVEGNGSTQFMIKETSSFQWNCSVQAGEDDELMWLHNGHPITLKTSELGKNVSCTDQEVTGLTVIQLPVQTIGRHEHLYQLSLLACEVSPQEGSGRYECSLNRSRGDPHLIWSVTLEAPGVNSTSSINSVVPSSESPSTSKGNIFNDVVSGGLGATVFVVFCVFLFLLVFFLYKKLCSGKSCCRASQKKNFLSDQMFSFNNGIFDTKMGEKPLQSTERECPVQVHDPNEFPLENLVLSDDVLGEGMFGVVVYARAEGIVKDDPNLNAVAVKKCRENLFHHRECLWEELQVMKKLAPHSNIVNLLGYSHSTDGALYLIIEFAKHGNLRDFLVNYRENLEQMNFFRSLPHGQLQSYSSCASSSATFSAAYAALREKVPLSQQESVFSMGSECTRSDLSSQVYHNLMSEDGMELYCHCSTQESGYFGGSRVYPMASSSSNDNSCSTSSCDLTVGTIQNFALQIALGLQHLESLNIVHCDLAARNILIAEGFLLKIGDFGMARDVSGEGCYIKHKEGEIPVKWAAPEVLQNNTFTHRSDVWSYGVILWEIFSYGDKPYPDQKVGHLFDSFIRYLMEGNRLLQPSWCPDHFYQLMQRCWQWSPDDRPTAADLVNYLSSSCAPPENEDIAAEMDVVVVPSPPFTSTALGCNADTPPTAV